MTSSLSRIALAAALLAALPVQAHRLWLLPSATTFSGGPGGNDWVTVDLAESSDLFYPDHRAPNPSTVKVWAPDGTPGKIQNPSAGQVRSTFDVQLDKVGTWRIGMEMTRLSGTFKVNGQEWRLGGRPGGGPGPGASAAQGRAGGPAPVAPQGGPGGPGRPGGNGPSVASIAEIPADATDVKITQMFGRNDIFVSEGEPTTAIFQPTGKGLEMVPVTHPDELVSNEPAKFRFLIDGQPAAGLKVTILAGGKRYRESENGMELATGGDGIVSIAWPQPGMFWINATATDQRPTEPRATDRRMSYTMTVDVLAP